MTVGVVVRGMAACLTVAAVVVVMMLLLLKRVWLLGGHERMIGQGYEKND